jgi:uncharacterized protein (TIGR02001 family)
MLFGMMVLPTAGSAQNVLVSYGVDVKSDYVVNGLTQTQGRPAIQPWVEATYGMLYVGALASNVQYAGVKDVELDVHAGITPVWGPIEFDIGYVHYLYKDDPREFGDVVLGAATELNPNVVVEAKYYYETRTNDQWVSARASYKGLPWGMTVSGGWGSDLGTSTILGQLSSFDLGIASQITDFSEFDLRGYHSSEDGSKILAELSLFWGTRAHATRAY